MSAWHEEPISRIHDLNGFHGSGQDFLVNDARKAHEWGAMKTFLAVEDPDATSILGYYTLAVLMIEARTKEPAPYGRYRRFRGFRLTHLGVSRATERRDFDGQLLLAAGRRCLLAASKVGSDLLVIDAARGNAATRFEEFGAMPLFDDKEVFVLPLATIQAALSRRKERKEETGILSWLDD